jgi:multiple sugar transport system permease protein
MKKTLRAIPFIGPHLVLFLVFALIPTVFGFYISLTQWNLRSAPKFVGFDNFATLLFDTDSPFHREFFNGLGNTLLFVVVAVPLLVGVPLLLAVALSRKDMRGGGFFQSLFYLPGLISVSAGGLAWTLIYNRQFGPLNALFGTDISFTTTQPWAWVTIFSLAVWGGIGANLVVYRAAIAAVPLELLESASLDGANSRQRFLHVTLPSIRFPLLYTAVLTTAATFNVFGEPTIMTRGGPNQSTTVLMMSVRDFAFGDGPSIAGMASAMAVLMGLVLLVIAAIQFRVLHRSVE